MSLDAAGDVPHSGTVGKDRSWDLGMILLYEVLRMASDCQSNWRGGTEGLAAAMCPPSDLVYAVQGLVLRQG